MNKFIALLAYALVNANEDAHFTYDYGGEDWGLMYPDC